MKRSSGEHSGEMSDRSTPRQFPILRSGHEFSESRYQLAPRLSTSRDDRFYASLPATLPCNASTRQLEKGDPVFSSPLSRGLRRSGKTRGEIAQSSLRGIEAGGDEQEGESITRDTNGIPLYFTLLNSCCNFSLTWKRRR